MAPKLLAIEPPSITARIGKPNFRANSAAEGISVVKPHDTLDEDQVGMASGFGQAPGDVVFAAHPQIDVLARHAAGDGVDLRVEKIRAALEDANAAAEPGMQSRQRGDHGGLALAGSRRGDEEKAGAGRHGYHSNPGMALTPALNACLTIVMSVTVSAASIKASGAARPVMMTCCSGGRAASTSSTDASSSQRYLNA